MSELFLIYLLVLIVSAFFAVLIVDWKFIRDPSRLIGWWIVIFLVTYLLRPTASQLIDDTDLLNFLQISSFDDVWLPMTVAVSSALLCAAIGYWIGRRSGGTEGTAESAARLDADRLARLNSEAAYLAVALCILG